MAVAYVQGARRQFLERVIWICAVLGIFAVALVAAILTLDRLTAPADASVAEALIFYPPRIGIGLLVVTVLTFALRQVSRHGDIEERERRLANELTSLPAFLDELELTEKQDLRKQVASAYFPGVNHPRDQRQTPGRTAEREFFGVGIGAMASLVATVAIAAIALAAILR